MTRVPRWLRDHRRNRHPHDAMWLRRIGVCRRLPQRAVIL